MTCDCDTRDPDPIESQGSKLHRCPHCPECGELASYQGAGSTGASNWVGKPFSVYYCEDCERHFKMYAAARMAP